MRGHVVTFRPAARIAMQPRRLRSGRVQHEPDKDRRRGARTGSLTRDMRTPAFRLQASRRLEVAPRSQFDIRPVFDC